MDSGPNFWVHIPALLTLSSGIWWATTSWGLIQLTCKIGLETAARSKEGALKQCLAQSKPLTVTSCLSTLHRLLMSPQNSYIEALTPDVAVFGDGL